MFRLTFILFLSFFVLDNAHSTAALFSSESPSTSPIHITTKGKRYRSPSPEKNNREESPPTKHFKEIYTTPPSTPNLYSDTDILDSASFLISPNTSFSLTPSISYSESYSESSSEPLIFPLSPYIPPRASSSSDITPCPILPIIDETPGAFLPDHKNRLRDNFKIPEDVIQIAEILNISLRIDSNDPDALMQHERLQPYVQNFLASGGKQKQLKEAIASYKSKRETAVRSKKYGPHTIDPETLRAQDGRWRATIQTLKTDNKKIFKSPTDKDKKPYYAPLSEDERRAQRHAAREQMRVLNAYQAVDGETLEDREKRILAPLQQFIKNEQEKFKADPKNYQKMDLESFHGVFYEFFKDALDKGEYYPIFHDAGYVWLVPQKLNLNWTNLNGETNTDLLKRGRSPVSLDAIMEAHHATMTDIKTSPNLYTKANDMIKTQNKPFGELNLSVEEKITIGCPVVLLSDKNHTYDIHPYTILSQVKHPSRPIFDKVRKTMNLEISKVHRTKQ